MKNNPLVSVILPSYNGSKYIQESIESILKQSFTDFELILVDDCSSDNTLSIMNEYAELDERITVIHNDHNCKLPGALNVGMSYAKGKFLTWSSDDNFYDRDAFRIMTTELLSELDSTAMVTCRYRIWNINENGDVVAESISDIYDEGFFYIHNIVGACFMYRSEVVDKIGLYDTSAFCAEDYDYWLRIYSEIGRIKFIDKVLYTYRQHPDNLTATKKKEIFIQTYRVLEKYSDKWLIEYKNKPDKLMCLYYMSVMSEGEKTFRIRATIKERLPILNEERFDFDVNERFTIWGCGDLGRKTAKLLRDKELVFIDTDLNKIGSTVDGIVVRGIESIKNVQDMPVIIAVRTESVYSVISKLDSLGISFFYTVWGLISVGKVEQLLW
ncbi:MAG: glycosyltransferase [Butyrivibrio sp.]|nr:glycosyltransferase [Butyrivibrio sp.]